MTQTLKRHANTFSGTFADISPKAVGVKIMPVGAYGIDVFGSNARHIALVGYRSDQKAELEVNRDYYICKTTLAADGKATHLVKPTNTAYKGVLFSSKSQNNIYFWGDYGIGFSSDGGSTIKPKNGDFEAEMGTLVVKKIQALVK